MTKLNSKVNSFDLSLRNRFTPWSSCGSQLISYTKHKRKSCQSICSSDPSLIIPFHLPVSLSDALSDAVFNEVSPFSLNTQFPTRRFICFFVSPFLAFLSSTQWQFRMGKHHHLIPRGGKMNSIAPRVHFSRECASLTSNYTENTHKDKLGNHSRANQLFLLVSLEDYQRKCDAVMSKSPSQIKTKL